MGCVASKLEEEEVVSICRERKHHLKLALERRYTLADAHCRYCQSLYAVAASIKLFIARHATPASPLFVTLPPATSNSSLKTPDKNMITTNPMFLQQGHHQMDQIGNCHDDECCGGSSTTSDFSEDEAEQVEEMKQEQNHQQQQGFGSYFYMQMPQAMMTQSPQTDFGWDFFNPFETMRPEEIISGYSRRVSDEDDDNLKVIREEEGIPDLEEEEGGNKEQQQQQVFETGKKKCVTIDDKVTVRDVEENGNNVVDQVATDHGVAKSGGFQGEQKGLTVIDSPETGRELLDAFKDIEDHFIRAYDSGKDVSRMLEANRVYLQSGVEEIKENSTKLLQIGWNRSTSFKPSSCKSLVASSSKGSSPWTEYKNDLFDDYGGMDSGSHSQTLGRLYAWEKKLYEEVKAGDSIRKIYEKKCSRLRNYDVQGDELTMDKTRATVKNLYARILVAIRSAESISKRIEKLRDEELQPQIVELLKGLTHTWKIMLESHETQHKILSEVKSFACPTLGKFCNDSHRLATLQLEAEIRNWRGCFTEYFSAQKAYVEALNGWLTKFVVPEVEFYSRGRRSAAPYRATGPPLLIICHNWLSRMENLPDKAVSLALKSFSKDVRALWVQQGEEQQQKRRVDSLAKELDRRTLSLQKFETRFVEIKLIEYKPDPDSEQQSDHLTDKKDQLDMFRNKLDIEKEKHHNCMQETHRITLSGLQTGFSAVFETLTEFSKASMKMYNDLINCSENTEKLHNQSYIEGTQDEENGSS